MAESSNGVVDGGLIISQSERMQNSEKVTRKNTEKFVEMKISSAIDGSQEIISYFVSTESRFPSKNEAVALHHQIRDFLKKVPIGGVDFDGRTDHMTRFFSNFFNADDEVREFKTGKKIYIPIIDDAGVQIEAGFELVINKRFQFQIRPVKDDDGRVDALAQEIEDKDIDD